MFGFFTNQLNTDDKKLYQKAVDLCKKRIKLERSKTYLEICIKHNLWPHFTNIKVRDQAVKNKDQTTRYRKFLLQNEIDKKYTYLENTFIYIYIFMILFTDAREYKENFTLSA